MKNVLLCFLLVLVAACASPSPQQPQTAPRATVPTILKVHVKADGSLGVIKLIRSCGYPHCDRAAVEVVKNSGLPKPAQSASNDNWVQVRVSEGQMEILK
ncbi:MAG: energy transducer TonB [Pseudomonadota bacterium]